jgi:peroxiredoxin
MIKFLLRRIMVGDKFPDITLPIYHQDKIQITQLKALTQGQPHLFIGHPGAFTVLTTTKQIPDYIEANIQVPIVLWSVNDPFVIRKYAQKYKIPFSIICDYNGELTRLLELGLSEENFFSFCCIRTLCLVKDSVVFGVSTELNVEYTKSTKPEMAKHLLKVI